MNMKAAHIKEVKYFIFVLHGVENHRSYLKKKNTKIKKMDMGGREIKNSPRLVLSR